MCKQSLLYLFDCEGGGGAVRRTAALAAKSRNKQLILYLNRARKPFHFFHRMLEKIHWQENCFLHVALVVCNMKFTTLNHASRRPIVTLSL